MWNKTKEIISRRVRNKKRNRKNKSKNEAENDLGQMRVGRV